MDNRIMFPLQELGTPIDFKTFEFVNFKHQVINKLKEKNSHLSVFHQAPTVSAFKDVIYTPHVFVSPSQYYGCLYDSDGTRIEQSCIYRDHKDCLTLEPARYQGETSLDRIEGSVMYLGVLFGHYGHFLLESLSRWWPLINSENRPQRFLFHLYNGDKTILKKSFVSKFLSCFGIEHDKIIYSSRPVKIDHLLLPEPVFRNRSYYYDYYRNIFLFVNDILGSNCCKITEQPLYFSRSLVEKRAIANENKLENLLLANDFKVVHPQNLSLEEQIRVINQHKYILGFSGSAMHNVVFSTSSKVMIHITMNDINSNYFLTDQCFDASSTFVHGYQQSLDYASLLKRVLKSPISGEKLDFIWQTRVQKYSLDDNAICQWLRQSGYVS